MIPTPCYVIIEASSSNEAGNIANVLLRNSINKFSVTDDIHGFAASKPRDQKDDVNVENQSLPRQQKQDIKIQIRDTGTSNEEWDDSGSSGANGQNLHSLLDQLNSQFLKAEPSDEPSCSTSYNQNRPSLDSMLESSNFPQDSPADLEMPMLSPSDETGSLLPVPYIKKYPSGIISRIYPFICQICNKIVNARRMDYDKRMIHAARHSKIKRYICPISDCGFRSLSRSDVVNHAQYKHQQNIDASNLIDITTAEEKTQLEKLVFKCFPEYMEILKDNPQYAEVVNDNEAERLYELQTKNGGAYEGHSSDSEAELSQLAVVKRRCYDFQFKLDAVERWTKQKDELLKLKEAEGNKKRVKGGGRQKRKFPLEVKDGKSKLMKTSGSQEHAQISNVNPTDRIDDSNGHMLASILNYDQTYDKQAFLEDDFQ
ncbi:hypothetical protein WR25_00185 [Diploscapter pachys]|uniref:Uncharacterized protein n=1 Tax=Diploscapter pachys TaxID=2018661 RepID=A0A2A2J4P7_9BILA|nr:hypothetical protein WR25_00185 [Diploscapter pachys]